MEQKLTCSPWRALHWSRGLLPVESMTLRKARTGATHLWEDNNPQKRHRLVEEFHGGISAVEERLLCKMGESQFIPHEEEKNCKQHETHWDWLQSLLPAPLQGRRWQSWAWEEGRGVLMIQVYLSLSYSYLIGALVVVLSQLNWFFFPCEVCLLPVTTAGERPYPVLCLNP